MTLNPAGLCAANADVTKKKINKIKWKTENIEKCTKKKQKRKQKQWNKIITHQKVINAIQVSSDTHEDTAQSKVHVLPIKNASQSTAHKKSSQRHDAKQKKKEINQKYKN